MGPYVLEDVLLLEKLKNYADGAHDDKDELEPVVSFVTSTLHVTIKMLQFHFLTQMTF